MALGVNNLNENLCNVRPLSDPRLSGMLEFLETIMGTSRFKEPIEQLAKRVEELSELRTEKLNRVKLVEKEKDELEGPMKEALGYIRLENEKVEIMHKQRQRYIVDSEKNIVHAVKKKEAIDASVSHLNEQQKEIVDRKKEKQGEIKEKGKSYEKLQKELDENKEKFDQFEKEDHGLREDMKNANVKRKKIKQDVEVDKTKREKLVNLPEENQKKIEECTEHRDTWEKKVEEKEAEYTAAMATLKSETQVHQDEKAVHETKLIDLKKTVNEAAEELNLATNEHDVYVSEEQKAKLRLDDMKNKIHNTKEQVKEKSKTLDDLNANIPAKERELEVTVKEIGQVADSHGQSRQRLGVMRTEYQEKKSSQTASQSNDRVLNALMAQKRNGNIPGIIGRLGDLGAIDKQYDVAVSTACGQLNTILVDSPDTGKSCIEFLRRDGVGRGNFMALSKCAEGNKYGRQMQPQQFPQGVPRLFDLVQPAEERFLPAFYHYMRDTLVCKNLEQAKEIGHGAKRFRTVDLVGNMVETTGTMAGGGQPRKGLMGQQVARQVEVDPRELQNMEQGIVQVQEEVEGYSRRRNQLDEKIATLKNSLKEEVKTQRKLAVEVNPLQQMMKELEAQVPAQERAVKEAAPDKKRVSEMKQRIDAAQAIYDTADGAAKEVEKEVKKCDAKINEIKGGKVKTVKKARDEAVKKFEQFKSEITKLGVEIKGNQRNLKKVTDKIESMEAEVKECEDSMTKMKERREQIEKEGGELLKDVGEKKEVVESLKETIVSLKKELEAVDKEETALKSSRIEVDQELTKWEDAVKDNTRKVQYWKKEIRKLSLQDVPGEDTPVLQELTEEQILEIDLEDLTVQITGIETKIAATKPNMAAIEEYNRKEKVSNNS